MNRKQRRTQLALSRGHIVLTFPEALSEEQETALRIEAKRRGIKQLTIKIDSE